MQTWLSQVRANGHGSERKASPCNPGTVTFERPWVAGSFFNLAAIFQQVIVAKGKISE